MVGIIFSWFCRMPVLLNTCLKELNDFQGIINDIIEPNLCIYFFIECFPSFFFWSLEISLFKHTAIDQYRKNDCFWCVGSHRKVSAHSWLKVKEFKPTFDLLRLLTKDLTKGIATNKISWRKVWLLFVLSIEMAHRDGTVPTWPKVRE